MSLTAKIISGVLVVLALILVIAYWQLKIVYQSWVASTSKGEPLFERTLLEDYGEKIISDLASKNVKLAIVSRAGQPRKQLPTGIAYTHSAFWIYEPGRSVPTYRVYNLYHGEDNRLISSLVTDEAADFLKLTREHDVGIIIPDTSTQRLLTDFIKSSGYQAVHQPAYSLISNPLDTRFQNCNEFMLDAMAAAFWNTTDADTIKARYQSHLEPSVINASIIRRKLGPRIDERLIMADHDKTILTTTRQTLIKFLEKENRLEEAYVLQLAPD